MVGQYEELSCPFCDKGVIQALYIPGAVSIKRSGARSLPGRRVRKSSSAWIIRSGCPACSKTLDEVERKFKEDGTI